MTSAMQWCRLIVVAYLLNAALPALGRITEATVARDDRAIILIANPFGYNYRMLHDLDFCNRH